MPRTKPENTPRRLIDLDIREVSLVDRAANLRRFLVIKRLEEPEMGAFQIDVDEVTKGIENEDDSVIALLKALTEAEDAPKNEIQTLIDHIIKAKPDEEEANKAKKPEDEENMSKAMPLELSAAIKAVVAWMKKMSKGPGAPTDAIARVAAFLGKVAGGKYPYPSPKSKQNPEDEYPSPKSKTKKDESGDLDGLNIRLTAEGDLIVSGQPVVKAKKFTSQRTSALKDTCIGLMKLIAEVDPAATKEIQEAAKELPTDPSVPSAVRPVGTGPGEPLKKSETEEKILKQLEDVSKRLEQIEKERPASQSLEDQGGTDDPAKKPVKKSLWAGIV